MHFGQCQQIYILPDTGNMISPHRTGRNNAATNRRIVFKQRLAANSHPYFSCLTCIHFIRNIYTERKENIKILSHLLLINIDFSISGYSLKIKFYLLTIPVSRNRYSFLHPCHFHLLPFFRIRRVIAMIGTFHISVGKRINIPGRRYFYASFAPSPFFR